MFKGSSNLTLGQIAEFPPDRVHGITGTKASARYDSLVSDFQSQAGIPLGRGYYGDAVEMGRVWNGPE